MAIGIAIGIVIAIEWQASHRHCFIWDRRTQTLNCHNVLCPSHRLHN